MLECYRVMTEELPKQNSEDLAKVWEGYAETTPLLRVKPITESRGLHIRSRSHLKEFVEFPLLGACEILYDKNIRTKSSSANQKDTEHGSGGYIMIDFDTLSEENKKIGLTLGEVRPFDGIQQLTLSIPFSAQNTVSDVRQHAERLANQFVKQAPTWIPSFSMEDLYVKYGKTAPDGSAWEPEDFSDQFYYSPETKRFYLSEEQYSKVREWGTQK